VSPVMKCQSLAIAVVAALCAACATPRTEAQVQADKELSAKVEAALNADKSLFAKHITAHANNGVVELSGFVWESGDFEEAIYVTQNVPGVTKVVNDLELNRNGDEDSPVAR
jgi:osmotically-inducible protein OsmY